MTRIASYLRVAVRQLNQGKVKLMDESAKDTFPNMTLWTEQVSGLYKPCSAESVDCQAEEKIKAYISTEQSHVGETLRSAYRAAVSLSTAIVGNYGQCASNVCLWKNATLVHFCCFDSKL